MSPITPTHIAKTAGPDRDGGLKIIAYYALLADVATFPAVSPTPTTYADRVTISGNFVMKSTKQFFKIESTLQKSGIDSESAGEAESLSAVNKLSLYHPGINPSFLGWLEENKNQDLVLIVEHLNGTKRVIGAEGLPARIIKFTQTGGKAVADPVNATVEIESLGRIAPIYTGTVPLTPAI